MLQTAGSRRTEWRNSARPPHTTEYQDGAWLTWEAAASAMALAKRGLRSFPVDMVNSCKLLPKDL